MGSAHGINPSGGNMKRLIMIVLALCSMPHAAQVTLSGTVKDNDGKALEGAKVALAKIKDLTTVTKTDGSFTLTNGTGVLAPEALTASFGVTFRNNCIVFFAGSEKTEGTISLHSGDGRLVFSVRLDKIQSGQQSVALPQLSSGMYLLTGTVGAQSFTRSLVCMGNNLYLRNETAKLSGNGSSILRKNTAPAVVDTLITSKDGYDTTRNAVASYTRDSIKIVMAKKGAAKFTITSTKFVSGDSMPDVYTCNGKSMGSEKAPPVQWSGAPAGTKSYAMTFLDTTLFASANPSMGFHWAMWNIPDSVTKMPEGLSGTSPSPEMGGAQQKSALGTKFFGPCPNSGSSCSKVDTYAFTVYAFTQAKISPTSTSIQTLSTWFNKNAVDSTKIFVKSNASTAGCP
jgi:Raf kinase inhibitor-like YbhB/YbcL family protein